MLSGGAAGGARGLRARLDLRALRPALGDPGLGRLPRRARARDQLPPRRPRPATGPHAPTGARRRSTASASATSAGPRTRRTKRNWAEEDESIWPPVRRFLVGLGLIAALALVFWFVESRSGWGSLSVETRTEAQNRFSEEASADRREAGADPLRRGGRVRGRRPARRRRRDRRRRALVPDAGALLRPLPARLRRRHHVQPDRPRDRRARPRVVAPPRRRRRGDDGVLRAPVGRRARGSGSGSRKGRRAR